MALTFDYQTNDISASSGSITIDGSAVTIDASQNLMVGTTTYNGPANATTGDYGAALWSSGLIAAGTNASEALVLNRMGSDGDIAVFKRSGTTVGSIGVASSYMVIGSPVGSDAHLLIGNGIVHPATSAGAAKDASIDIGGSSNRFKDLYLSGGIVFDAVAGNATSNTLDDYEEGTFTPGILNGWGILNPTYSTQAGFYTKVGNIVHVAFRITLSGGSTNANGLKLTGLPFTVGATTNVGTNLSGWMATAASNAEDVFLGLEANETEQYFYYQNSNGTANFLGTDAGTSLSLTFSGTYQTA